MWVHGAHRARKRVSACCGIAPRSPPSPPRQTRATITAHPPQTHAPNNLHAWSAPRSFTPPAPPPAETTSPCHQALCYTCLPASSTPDRSMVMNSGATFSTIRPHDQASERYVVVARDDHRARKPEELGALVEAKRAACTAGSRCDTWVRIRRVSTAGRTAEREDRST